VKDFPALFFGMLAMCVVCAFALATGDILHGNHIGPAAAVAFFAMLAAMVGVPALLTLIALLWRGARPVLLLFTGIVTTATVGLTLTMILERYTEHTRLAKYLSESAESARQNEVRVARESSEARTLTTAELLKRLRALPITDPISPETRSESELILLPVLEERFHALAAKCATEDDAAAILGVVTPHEHWKTALTNLKTSCARTNELLTQAVATSVVSGYRVNGRANYGLARQLALADPSHRLFELVHQVVRLAPEEQVKVVMDLFEFHELDALSFVLQRGYAVVLFSPRYSERFLAQHPTANRPDAQNTLEGKVYKELVMAEHGRGLSSDVLEPRLP
jgi:hypothetical protein